MTQEQELPEHCPLNDNRRRWHVGREIPLALLSGLIVNAAVLVWGAATLHSKVENSEKAAATAIKVQADIDSKQDENQRRSEERIMVQLDKIFLKLDVITDRVKR